jgi:hypothetical protein
VKTVVVIAEGYLWEHGVGHSPGAIKPDAKAKLEAAKKLGRVVIVTPCANTETGLRICQQLLYRDIGGPFDELWCSPGCPVFDVLIAAGTEAAATTRSAP